MSEVKTYEIGGKTYEQRELVYGQVRQLRRLVEGLELPAASEVIGWAKALVVALEETGKLDTALAILLTEAGADLKSKDLAALAAELEFGITPQQIAEVFTDFFTCNPTSSVLEMLAGILERLVECLTLTVEETTSRRLCSFSQMATFPAAKLFSGGFPPGKAALGSSTVRGD